MTTVIEFDKVSKFYELGKIGGGTLSSDINRWWARVRGKPDPLLKIGETDYGNREGTYIWALRDVSFEVQQGEVLGIIGRNGAGKSTLLKLLSRVTAPTSGEIRLKGRVASLLEVGTGFHPELTGRENIYLNGSILGMTKQEVSRKFDEIVAFSEVERFIDTPVKRYSSGMYVRLAFAVAAHLEPEILVVDEVLAVGDAAFQKKCLGKMGEVAQGGRTVLFVSHNMASIKNLCKHGILMDHGHLKLKGNIDEVVDAYLLSSVAGEENGAVSLAERTDRKGSREVRFTKVRILYEGKEVRTIPMGATFTVEAEFDADVTVNRPLFGITFKNALGQTAMRAFSNESAGEISISRSNKVLRCTFYDVPLMHGEYQISLFVGRLWEPMDQIENAISLTILASDVYGTGVLPNRLGGAAFARHTWELTN